MEQALDRSLVTLGILAGGRASRLGGRDKAWLERGGVSQVVRLANRLEADCGAVLVSANANLGRYDQIGLSVVSDRATDVGPLAGLHALAHACTTPWLLTLPVDVIGTSDGLVQTLAMAGEGGAVAEDEDGPQPLVALYRVEAMRVEVDSALAAGEHAVHAMQKRLDLPRVRFTGVRFGNLNTPDDLLLVGIVDA